MLLPKRKKKAIAYVDFDHWCISMYTNFGGKPDVRGWYEDISREYDLTDVCFFGDFSNPKLREMLTTLREISNTVIETQNADEHAEKEYTDFIMLDHIYRHEIDGGREKVVLIFSGDGHFSSVVAFLIHKRHKEVVVYGVRNAFSGQLKALATKAVELPTASEMDRCYYRAIYRRIADLYSARKDANPTFQATTRAVAAAMGVDREVIENAMQEMIAKGYLYQVKKPMGPGRVVKILRLDSEKIAAAGFFEQ